MCAMFCLENGNVLRRSITRKGSVGVYFSDETTGKKEKQLCNILAQKLKTKCSPDSGVREVSFCKQAKNLYKGLYIVSV